MNVQKKFLKEPFLHFVLLGVALFALNAWRQKQKPPTDAAPRIEVTASVIERLRAGYERQFGQPPSQDELRGLVTAHVREEVLYREALAMGLDLDDTIVRRRMAQKMEFLTDDVAGAAEADDAALRRYFGEHAARYAKPARVSFRHIYFSKEKRGAGIEAVARDGIAALTKGADEETLGDAFLHGSEFVEQEPADITALFGKDFSTSLEALRTGEWNGPVVSSYGLHLVRVDQQGEARAATFDEVRDAVVRDFNEERRRKANREVFDKLRERYHVVVDEAALAKAAATPTRTAQR